MYDDEDNEKEDVPGYGGSANKPALRKEFRDGEGDEKKIDPIRGAHAY